MRTSRAPSGARRTASGAAGSGLERHDGGGKPASRDEQIAPHAARRPASERAVLCVTAGDDHRPLPIGVNRTTAPAAGPPSGQATAPCSWNGLGQDDVAEVDRPRPRSICTGGRRPEVGSRGR